MTSDGARAAPVGDGETGRESPELNPSSGYGKGDADRVIAPPLGPGTWKAVVEFSSIATLLSFLISAGTLYSILEKNGVRFSAIVGVNDIVIYGVWQLLSTISWMIYILPGIILMHIAFVLATSLRDIWSFPTSTRMKTVSSTVILLIVTLIGVAIAIYSSPGNDDMSMWEGWLFGSDIPYFRMISDVGLVNVYLILLSVEGALFAGRWFLKFAGGAEPDARPSAEETYEAVALPWASGFFLFVTSSIGLAAYASYSKLDRDFSRGIGILDGTPRPAACAGVPKPLLVAWVGESSVVVRCGARIAVIKGSENLPIMLGKDEKRR